jgi:hypothetical protein
MPELLSHKPLPKSYRDIPRKGQAKYACNRQPSLAEQFDLLAA